MIENYVQNILALSFIKGVGPAFMKKSRTILMKYRNTTEMLTKIGGKVTEEAYHQNLKTSQEVVEYCLNNEIGIITIADDWYPKLLMKIKDPPPIIYFKGNLENIKNPIALIGTRRASNLGMRIAEKVSENFSQNFSICNGLAEGIDQSAIEPKGKTIGQAVGVLSGGLNLAETLSKKNARLAESVLDNNGLLISEFTPHKKEDAFTPIRACRIQAGLSKALILIQSPKDGGSRYTLKSFCQVNRPFGVIDFRGNKEYDTSEMFSANRTIAKNKLAGLAEVTSVKRIAGIKIKSIHSISGENDYEIIKEKMKTVVDNV